MAVNLIGGVTSPTLQTPNLQTLGVSQEDFFKILVTQLSFQDPLKPIDNQAFIAQIAQFTTLEQTRELNDRIDTLLNIQSTSQSIGLIGKTVEVASSSGPVVGTVTTLSFQSGQPFITVQTQGGQFLTGITLDQVTVVRSSP
jgi:flagellar basal-body rod modification protein FlgD